MKERGRGREREERRGEKDSKGESGRRRQGKGGRERSGREVGERKRDRERGREEERTETEDCFAQLRGRPRASGKRSPPGEQRPPKGALRRQRAPVLISAQPLPSCVTPGMNFPLRASVSPTGKGARTLPRGLF